MNLSGSGLGQFEGFCEHDDEPAGAIKFQFIKNSTRLNQSKDLSKYIWFFMGGGGQQPNTGLGPLTVEVHNWTHTHTQ